MTDLTGQDQREGLSPRVYALLSGVFIILIFAISSARFSYQKTVTIIDDGLFIVTVKSHSSTVNGFIKEQGIKLNTGDRIEPPLDAAIKDNSTVEVYRAIHVIVTAHGHTKDYYTTERYSLDVLSEIGIEIAEDEVVSPPQEEELTGGEVIVVQKKPEPEEESFSIFI